MFKDCLKDVIAVSLVDRRGYLTAVVEKIEGQDNLGAALDKEGSSDELRRNGVTRKLVVTPA